MPTFAIVADVDPGEAREVGLRLHTVPPFELPLDGVDGHQVFLGTEHAAFLFWGADPEAGLVRVAGDPGVRSRGLQAIAGLHGPRKLDQAFGWARGGGAADRAVALITRGVDERSTDPKQLVEALGGTLWRLRVFAAHGIGLVVVERSPEPTGAVVGLDELAEVSPVEPLRPPELLDETYRFEDGEQLPARPSSGIVS